MWWLTPAAVYIILVPALILPHEEVARMIDTRPMKFFELLWRNKRFCHYYHRHRILENIFTVCSMLGQTRFSALDSQPLLILPQAADLPSFSLKELRSISSVSKTFRTMMNGFPTSSWACSWAVLGPHESWAVLTSQGHGETSAGYKTNFPLILKDSQNLLLGIMFWGFILCVTSPNSERVLWGNWDPETLRFQAPHQWQSEEEELGLWGHKLVFVSFSSYHTFSVWEDLRWT